MIRSAIIFIFHMFVVMCLIGCGDGVKNKKGGGTHTGPDMTVPNPDSPNGSEPDISSKSYNLFSSPVGEKDSYWFDSASENSLIEIDFMAYRDLSKNSIYGTKKSLFLDGKNFHSHYLAQQSHSWKNYRFTGAMMADDDDGSLGVTFYSDYLNSDRYYRIRRFNFNDSDKNTFTSQFHFAPHPDDGSMDYQKYCSNSDNSSTGKGTTTLSPVANHWYRFDITVTTYFTHTHIQALLWDEQNPEFKDSIDCYDYSSNRISQGTVGIWALGTNSQFVDPGSKFFKDFNVELNASPLQD